MIMLNKGKGPYPLILDLHGWTESAESQQHRTGWGQLGLDENVIIVWPDGMNDSPNSMGNYVIKHIDLFII